MAWQVLLVRLPESSLDALPVDFVPPVLGKPQHVADRISTAASRACVTPTDIDCDGHRLVVMRTDDFIIEAELGGTIDVDRVLLRVLGSEAALPLVGALARELDTSAIDCETDTVLDADAIIPDTLRQWQTRIDDLR